MPRTAAFGGGAVERRGGGEIGGPGVDQLPHHPATEAEADDAKGRAGRAAAQLREPAAQVSDEVGLADAAEGCGGVGGACGAARAGEQVGSERRVAVTREPPGDGPDVVGEASVLVHDQHGAACVLRDGESP
jgi:hypothetical protein